MRMKGLTFSVNILSIFCRTMGISILFVLLAEVSGNLSDSLKQENLINQVPTDKWFTRDKFHHFSYSLGITGLSYHIYHCQFGNSNPGARYFSISLSVLVGMGKEIYDKYCKKAVFSYKDLTIDAAGIIIGVLLFTL